MNIPDLQNSSKVFEQYPGIQAVYLFISCAPGRVPSQSGNDFAVFYDDDRLPAFRLDILAKLADAGICDFELVFLPDDNIILRYQAVRMNRIVYQRTDFDSASTFSLIVRQYLDFLPYLEVHNARRSKTEC